MARKNPSRPASAARTPRSAQRLADHGPRDFLLAGIGAVSLGRKRLLSAYGARLADFNARLKVRVKSESPLPGGKGVKVETEFVQPDQTVTPITFYARNVGGQWKVFDVLPEGVSFVQTFKTQFDTPLRQKSIAQVASDLKSGKLQVNGSASGK